MFMCSWRWVDRELAVCSRVAGDGSTEGQLCVHV